MYAVIRTGGKQYRVSAGDQLEVEKLDVQAGAELVLSEVLMLGEGSEVSVGAPLVTGATVRATVLGQGKGDKVHIFKMRRRKHYRKSQGHRQPYTSIRIDSITAAN
jgi:large subunit ribosomal protein L21